MCDVVLTFKLGQETQAVRVGEVEAPRAVVRIDAAGGLLVGIDRVRSGESGAEESKGRVGRTEPDFGAYPARLVPRHAA